MSIPYNERYRKLNKEGSSTRRISHDTTLNPKSNTRSSTTNDHKHNTKCVSIQIHKALKASPQTRDFHQETIVRSSFLKIHSNNTRENITQGNTKKSTKYIELTKEIGLATNT